MRPIAVIVSVLVVIVCLQCLYDGSLLRFTDPLRRTAAVMSASLISISPGFLRNASFGVGKALMPILTSRAQSTDATATPQFTYRLAAAAAGKRTPPRQPKLGRDFWTFSSTQAKGSRPYLRSTKSNSGEDAFFISTVGSHENNVAFGLADGVGGWQDQGVDPSDFSHGLCGYMAGEAYNHEGLKYGGQIRPKDLMQTAYDAVIANPRIVAGGCTASLAVAGADGSMESAK